jgi:hypothetical protein
MRKINSSAALLSYIDFNNGKFWCVHRPISLENLYVQTIIMYHLILMLVMMEWNYLDVDNDADIRLF